MMGSVGKSLTALKAFGAKMEVTSKNIANGNSDEFKKSRVTLKENANGGVNVLVERVDSPGPETVSREDGQEVKRELSNVDLTEEMTEMVVAKNGYGANLKALETQDEMLGAALDIVG